MDIFLFQSILLILVWLITQAPGACSHRHIKSRLGTLYDLSSREIFFFKLNAREWAYNQMTEYQRAVDRNQLPLAPFKYATHFYKIDTRKELLAISVDFIYLPDVTRMATKLGKSVSVSFSSALEPIDKVESKHQEYRLSNPQFLASCSWASGWFLRSRIYCRS